MRLRASHGWLLALVCSLAIPAAHAESPIDMVADAVTGSSIDPFRSEKKIRPFTHRKPVDCPPKPDTSRKLKPAEVVIAALCHNPDTRAAYLSLLSSAASFSGGYSAYLPTVSASASANRSRASGASSGTTIANSTGVSAGMTLYDFGQREFSIEAAEQTLIASGHSYDSSLQGLIASSLQSYYSLLTAQNSIGVTQESEKLAKESFDAAELRHRIGQAPLADKLQARDSYSQAILATQTAQNSLYLAQAAISVLMGLAPDTPVTVEEVNDANLTSEPFGDRLKDLMEKAKAQRVDLEASRAGLRGSELSLKALKRSNMATVTAGVTSGFDDAKIFNNNTTRTNAISLSVNIPIFTGFSQTYAERAARRSLEAQREQLVKSELGVEQDVFTAYHNYQTARQSWEVSFDRLASATELRDVALGRYKEGIGTILDVLSAQTSYSSALQSQLDTRYNLLTARLDLVRAVGVLDVGNMMPENKVVETPPVQPFALD